MIAYLLFCIGVLFVLLFVLLIFFLCFMFLYNKIEKPIIYKDLNIQNLKKYNIKNLIKNYGLVDIYVSHSNSKDIDMDGNIKKMKIHEFCKIMNDDTEWYFKSEDEYDFLNIIGIKNVVMKEFDKLFDNYSNVLSKDCSFWLGGKGSTTGWHTDIDDLSYLYVIEGKKKIHFASPKFNENMYEKKIFTNAARWSEIDFKNVDYQKYPKFKDVKIETYILNSGDGIFIPKNWWHCVENMDETVAITYKIFRYQYLYSKLCESWREFHSKNNGYKIYDLNEIIKQKIPSEDLIKMKELINMNNELN